MARRSVTILAAVALAATGTLVGTQFASGAPDGTETVFVPITPCRLVDTRPNTATSPAINVGPRNTKLGADEAASFTAWGTGDGNSPCEVPATAVAIATNTVAVSPSARSFMTLYPADVANPGTANLNYIAGQAPTPNAANIPLSPTGTFSVFNAFGTVHVVIDVNGYYQPSSAVGGTGPAGPAGPSGASLYERTIIVKAGGSATANGAALLAAVSDPGPMSATSVSPWQIRLEPGIYDVGGTQIKPPRHVSLAGAGRDVTTVQGAIRSNNAEQTAVLLLQTGSTAFDMTVVNSGGAGEGNFARGIHVTSGSRPALRDLVIKASGTSSPSGVGISQRAVVEIERVDIELAASNGGRGIALTGTFNEASEVVIRDSRISVLPPTAGIDNTAGVNIDNGRVHIDGVEISAGAPVSLAAYRGRTIDAMIDRSNLTALSGGDTIRVFNQAADGGTPAGTSNVELRYVELSHKTELDEATTADCKGTVAPVGFLNFGCPS